MAGIKVEAAGPPEAIAGSDNSFSSDRITGKIYLAS
jgi:hypothetical protein